MDLYIIRHAWAFDRDSGRWPDDDLRPLTKEGKERFEQVVKKLVPRAMAPEVIATSPLVRCAETAAILAAGVPDKPEVAERDELRPDSDLDGLLRWTIREMRQHERIAWVGHNPDVGLLTAALMGEPTGQLHFAKGGAACIQFADTPALGGGALRWLVAAKVLGC